MSKSNPYPKLPRIVAICAVQPYHLTCDWTTGETRVINLEPLLRARSHAPKSKYRTLLEPAYFITVSLNEEAQTIGWDNGLDFCPDVLYEMSDLVAVFESQPLEPVGLPAT